VSLRAFAECWNQFFFQPKSPLPIASFRILYGILVIANLLLLWPDWLAWFGVHAWMSLSTMYKVEPGIRLNLFTVIPQNDRWSEAIFWVGLIWAAFVAIGFLTRLSSIATFLCLASINERNLFAFHAGDTFLRIAGFFLIFAPAGAALSVDRILRVRKGREGLEIASRSPWAQRMIQLQLSFVYFFAFWWKSMGAPWVNGTALYYLNHLDEIHRLPIPGLFQSPIFTKVGSWLTLALEFSLGVLIWFKELRYPLLIAGVLFHLTLEYALNVPMFQWEMISAYVLFVDPADLERAGRWTRARTAAISRIRFGASPSRV